MQQIIDLLGSPEVAIDDHHSPKLYARFLAGLLSKPAARLDRSPTSKKPALKSKSESPTTHKAELQDAVRQSMSSPPSARPSSSPEPEGQVGNSASAMHLDQYQFGHDADMLSAMDVASEFFAPPLPLNDLLPSMADPSMTAMAGVPGEPYT